MLLFNYDTVLLSSEYTLANTLQLTDKYGISDNYVTLFIEQTKKTNSFYQFNLYNKRSYKR